MRRPAKIAPTISNGPDKIQNNQQARGGRGT